ncbi:MAG: hypothetical protein AAB281_00750 [Actinomycetota bacterium]
MMLSATVLFSACGDSDNAKNGSADGGGPPGHQLSQEQVDKMLGDLAYDLSFIGSVGPGDTAALATVLTGAALSDTQNTITSELAQGKYKKRIYEDINARLEVYNYPSAEVFVEFTDKGYYIDPNTQAVLDQPTSERKAYSLSLVQENERWKINGIYLPSTSQ